MSVPLPIGKAGPSMDRNSFCEADCQVHSWHKNVMVDQMSPGSNDRDGVSSPFGKL